MLRHPLEAVAPGRRRRAFGLLLLATLLSGAVLAALDGPLRTPAAPAGIVSFELAGSVARAAEIVASWGPDARLQAAFGLGFDFLFLALYSTTLAAACLWAGRRLGPRAEPLGPALAWAQWGAAALDACENGALWKVLAGPVVAPWPQIAWACAVPKFALLAAGLALAAAGALVGRRGHR